MAEENKGLVGAGASLMMRHQRVFWWVLAVNFVLGGLGAHVAAHTLHEKLSHTLAGESLVSRFDLGMFFELIDRPEVNLLSSHADSLMAAALFFLFMLFIAGGIVTVYWQDRRLNTGEFFAASGAFFWRFLRLLLLSLVPLILVGAIYSGAQSLSDYVDERAVADQSSFYILLLGIIVCTLLALLVRLWFDIAQVRAVVQNERGMFRNMWKAFNITWANLGTLFRAYFCISFFAWATLAIGVWIWTLLPARTIPLTFLLLELIIVTQIASRLWQRATAVTWYQRNAPPVPIEVLAHPTVPLEVFESDPAPANAVRPSEELHITPEPFSEEPLSAEEPGPGSGGETPPKA